MSFSIYNSSAVPVETKGSAKRRVLYIKHRRKIAVSDAFRLNQDEWIEAMSIHADVFLAETSFDLYEACDRIRPDFILYESPSLFPEPLEISNPKAHPNIPRIAFQMQDPYCSTRVSFLRTIEELGVKWIFTHMPELALRQSPELRLRTFSVSHMFDENLFKDYGLKKDIPVSVFGGFLVPEIYNWRAEIADKLPHRFPTFIYTHPGYKAPVPKHKFPVYGEAYARLLNRSHFSLADTTRFDCFLRKHLEIPASGAVLIAPNTPALKPYGFNDMENCILGTGDELFDKMAAVADDPDMYERIRTSGYNLVHGKYGRSKWTGILDFYECLAGLKPGQTIRQEGLFGRFYIVPEDNTCAPAIDAHYPDSEVSALAKMWLNALATGEGIDEIMSKTSRLCGWMANMTEYWVPMGVFAMLKGDLETAKKCLLTPHKIRQTESGFEEYDPEEIAWLSLAAALSGDKQVMLMTKKESAHMRHLSLRRMEWLGYVSASGSSMESGDIPEKVQRRLTDDHMSIHWTGQMEMRDWLKLIRRVLDANGQAGIRLPSFQ